MSRRVIVWVLALACSAVAGCDNLRAQTADVFITREATIAFDPVPTRPGETILTIENNDDAEHRPLLIRLDDGLELRDLPLTPERTVDVGDPIDLEYAGDGYQVVEKLDTMRPYYGSGRRIETVVHVYLRPGRYVLLDNLPGGVDAGTVAIFEVQP